jgi:hypothetical protein
MKPLYKRNCSKQLDTIVKIDNEIEFIKDLLKILDIKCPYRQTYLNRLLTLEAWQEKGLDGLPPL